MTRKGYCLELGIEEYDRVFQLQEQLNRLRRNGTIPDTLMILEHLPCLTIGRSGGFGHILASSDRLADLGMRVYETDRGGDITYHGPGQLICYPIIDLNDHGRDVHVFARGMEEMMIGILEAFGINGGRREGYPGVWVGPSKIGAMGIGVRSWVTMHGVSLNVCPDLDHFSLIVPCGISAFGVTSMEKALGRPVDKQLVRREMRAQFSRIFDLELEEYDIEAVEGVGAWR